MNAEHLGEWLRRTADEVWEQWYTTTRLIFADWLEENHPRGVELATALRGLESYQTTRWEASIHWQYQCRSRVLELFADTIVARVNPNGGRWDCSALELLHDFMFYAGMESAYRRERETMKAFLGRLD